MGIGISLDYLQSECWSGHLISKGARSRLQAPVGIRSGAFYPLSAPLWKALLSYFLSPHGLSQPWLTAGSNDACLVHMAAAAFFLKLEYHCCMMWGCFRCLTVWISQGRRESPPPRASLSSPPASHPLAHHGALSWAPCVQQLPASSLCTHGGVHVCQP